MGYQDPPGYATPRIAIFGGGQNGKSYLARKLARKVVRERERFGLPTQTILCDSNDDWRIKNPAAVVKRARELFDAVTSLDPNATIVYTGTEEPDERLQRLSDRFWIPEEAHNYMGSGEPPPFWKLLYLQGSSHRCNPVMTITHRPQEIAKVAMTSASEVYVFPIKEERAQEKISTNLGIPRAELAPARFQPVMIGGKPHPNAKYPLKFTNADGLLPYPWIEPD